MKLGLTQIESKCSVRKEAPTPQTGDLPLPAGLEQKLQYQPNSVEDLNVVVPEGAAKLSTPQYDQNVSCEADAARRTLTCSCLAPCSKWAAASVLRCVTAAERLQHRVRLS